MSFDVLMYPSAVDNLKENHAQPRQENHSLTKNEAQKQMSSPNFLVSSEMAENGVNDLHLSRSPEVENIPRQVLEVNEDVNHVM